VSEVPSPRGQKQQKQKREAPKRPSRQPGSVAADPRKHAAQLLQQADRLAQLAYELRREARRLNASLGIPVPPTDGSRRRVKPSPRRAPRVSAERPQARERRFAPAPDGSNANDGNDGTDRPIERKPDAPEISDGARLLITGMAITGSSREEILGLMEDELGLENADAILESLSL
jgi:hypothetical protein